MVKHYFSPKMCRKKKKKMKIGLQIKNLMSKMFLNRDFAQAREIIQTSLSLDSSKFVILFQTFGPLVSFS